MAQTPFDPVLTLEYVNVMQSATCVLCDSIERDYKKYKCYLNVLTISLSHTHTDEH